MFALISLVLTFVCSNAQIASRHIRFRLDLYTSRKGYFFLSRCLNLLKVSG
jgi:hypothetical protein